MEILSDINKFVQTLTFVDFVFFFAVVVLIILIIALVYFIRVNEEVLRKENEKPKSELEMIKDAISSESKEKNVIMSTFEKEQEDKAIISYEELLNKSKNYGINYLEEKEVDGLTIKKVNLSDMYTKEEEPKTVEPIRVVSYKKEEEFLVALKNLKSLLS